MPDSRRLQQPSLRLYVWLAKRQWPRSYAGKLLFVAFVGTHVPLIGLIAFFLGSESPSDTTTARAVIVTIAATLAGTTATLYGLHRLLAPVLLTQRALHDYVARRELPNLPTAYGDEAGTLMADTQHTLQQLDAALHRLAHYDDATGLPNRALLAERARRAVAHARRDRGRSIALLVLDIQGIDDAAAALGTGGADQLLRAVAHRLGGVMRETDTLARIGDRSLAVLSTDAVASPGLMAQAGRLADAVDRALTVPDAAGEMQEVHLTVAAGIATIPEDAGDVDALLQRAQAAARDAAVEARGDRRSLTRFYSPDIHTRLQERMELERDLRLAIERNEFLLEYQPKIALASGLATEVEALVRWRHPERGIISPATFIPLAESTGLIVPLGEWVLTEACRQARVWVDAGHPVRMAVNVSAQQVARTDVVALTRRVLAETRLEPRLLELEITESLLVADLTRAATVLGELRALGVTVALDDFGTGYSSLNYLRTLPVDSVKIDRSFVRDIGQTDAGGAVVDAVLAMARGLSLVVVAEGVETAAQLAYLRDHGCDAAQGFYFARPMSPADLARAGFVTAALA